MKLRSFQQQQIYIYIYQNRNILKKKDRLNKHKNNIQTNCITSSFGNSVKKSVIFLQEFSNNAKNHLQNNSLVYFLFLDFRIHFIDKEDIRHLKQKQFYGLKYWFV